MGKKANNDLLSTDQEGRSTVHIKWLRLVQSTYNVFVVFGESKERETLWNAFKLVLEATYHPTVYGVGSFLRRSCAYA